MSVTSWKRFEKYVGSRPAVRATSSR